MNYKVIPSDEFENEAKRLSKKYKSLKQELFDLVGKLAKNPLIGTSLGKNAYKIRIAIKSKNSGKSGGARVVTYLVNEKFEINLVTIFDKSEISNISDGKLKQLISEIIDKKNESQLKKEN